MQVPRWIIKPLSGRTAAHGIENLDDEVFSKRHLKHEVDEKRRKRYYKKLSCVLQCHNIDYDFTFDPIHCTLGIY